MSTKTVKEQLFQMVKEVEDIALTKVTIVGVGQVGMACAYSMVNKRVVSELCLVDVDEKKLQGELMDLQHGMQFVGNIKLQAGTNYELTAGSKLCILTAGVRQREGEDRRSLLDRNVSIFKGIVPELVKYSPDTILLVVSNPVDVMAYITWKLSGLPSHRVFGSGTSLDSSRLRHQMSERLGIDPTSCHGYVIGEHGESSVVVWSGLNVSGVRLVDLNPKIGTEEDPERWVDVHKQVINGATDVIKLKGYTSWAIGLCVSELAACVLRNKKTVYPLSTMAKGVQGIEHEIFVSLPCTLSQNGVNAIINMKLTDSERSKLQKSADELHELFKTAKI
ncbi:hypothetical protein RvY_10496 [Ramazzottius varieornatus]|uniref:L-lactate dehydrogenase n=1 Tax=Ramazzottius varieornatus TaxID=947166 RepID=A0A1D1VKQ3_RAMVA|nr:hypothetical protein RvY_10496 [Ramazzottius varieornatus]